MIIISFSLLVFGELGARYLLGKFRCTSLIVFLLSFGRYLVGFIAMIFVFIMVYRYTPSKRLNWKEVLPGALFSTLGWILTSIGFSYYVNNFGNYSKVYGSIGAVIALMSWLFISSVIILMGGELNATLAYRELNLEKHKGKKY
jgi:membrane protein